jgi:hypothetical protein
MKMRFTFGHFASTRTGRFLSALLMLTLCVQPLLITGCGSSGSSAPSAPTAATTGKINTSEVGGSSLQVVSAYQNASPIDAGGNCSTTVSTQGAQLLMATDNTSQNRALAISLPTTGSNVSVQFDADSTAATLVFMTYGIMTINATDAATRLRQIRNLTSFPALASLLRADMPTETLAQLSQDAQVTTAMENCVNAWLTTYAAPAAQSLQRRSRAFLVDGDKGLIDLTVQDSSNLSNVKLQIDNNGWRYVDIFRRDLNNGVEQRVTDLGTMTGCVGWSLGSIFTKTVNDPTTITTTADFSQQSGNPVSEYWCCGPGWGSDADTLPSSIQAGKAAWGKTLVFYGVMPLIDLILGAKGAWDIAWDTPAGNDDVEKIWNAVEATVDLTSLRNETDFRSICRDVIDATQSIISAAISSGALAALGVSPWALLLLAGISMDMPAANLIVAVTNWTSLPSSCKWTVTSTGDMNFVIQ